MGKRAGSCPQHVEKCILWGHYAIHFPPPFQPRRLFCLASLFMARGTSKQHQHKKHAFSPLPISPRKHDNKQILFRFNNILINSHKCCGDLLTRRQNYVLVLLTL